DVQNNPHVYMAVYSSIPIYEMMVNGIGVMRRRSDSFMNATQILKVAGVDKSKRARIVERDFAHGEHEKVQGGYGKYQGTWIPFARARELAVRFGVADLLEPILNYLPAPTSSAQVSSITSTSVAKTIRKQKSTSQLELVRRSIPRISSQLSIGQSQSCKRERSSNSSLGICDNSEIVPKKRSKMDSPSHHSAFSEPILSLVTKFNLIYLLFTFLRLPFELMIHLFLQLANSIEYPDPSASTLRVSIQLKPSNHPPKLALEDAQRTEKNIHALMALFSSPEVSLTHKPESSRLLPGAMVDVNRVLGDSDLDIHTPVDEHCHTALHWAAALGRLELVRAFISAGADVECGNNFGETALVRATLVTNNFEKQCFDQLLDFLHPSLWTLDSQSRTVLHHICLTANTKGRAESSRYYMECIFEWIVNNHSGRFDSIFIDAMDLNGDTALNIAARVGNKHLVRMLLDVGADKSKGNKLGLMPTDFGIDGEEDHLRETEQSLMPYAQNLPTSSSAVQKSEEILTSINLLIRSFSHQFESEVQSKNASLEGVRAQLKFATRELTDQRRRLEELRQLLDEKALLQLRLKKLRVTVAEEDGFDWTGRSGIDGRPAQAGKAFEYRGPNSTLVGLSAAQIQLQLEPDPNPPTVNNTVSVVYLRRMEAWYRRVLGLLRERIQRMRGSNLEQEAKYLKVISSFIARQKTNDTSGKNAVLLNTINDDEGRRRGIEEGIDKRNGLIRLEDLKKNNGGYSFKEQSESLNVEHHQEKLLGEDMCTPFVLDGDLLNQLMTAIESDGPELDLNRVAGFMQRVQSGGI
ncbi:hypothetical protein BY996DRAFT_4589652, partial [Phakopsora pachyrhizi]